MSGESGKKAHMAEIEGTRGGEVGDEVRDIMGNMQHNLQGLVCHYKDIGFYFEWDRQLLEGFNERSDLISCL